MSESLIQTNVPGAFSAYLPIRQHGIIGDRRTAALVASDGTLDWLCLPDYDGTPVFGALLDAERGGWWRIGPSEALAGEQSYLPHTALLTTTWHTPDYELELTDGMAWPEERRRPSERETGRVVLRRLRCRRGRASCEMRCYPADGFESREKQVQTDRVLFQTTAGAISLFGAPRWGEAGQLQEARILLNQGEQAWAVGVLGEIDIRWTDETVMAVLDDTTAYWHRWRRNIIYGGPRADRVERSAIIVHLLSHAPTGSLVAAPTSSLPERIGGDRNYDYRYAWVRDASLSLAIVALLGDRHAAQRYMDWIAKLESTTDAPLQVLYRLNGATDVSESQRYDLAGYRDSRPVRFGNHAFKQLQHDSLGYFVDCAAIYLEQGGEWHEEYWHLIERIADYVIRTWQQPDSGIWELGIEQHYVSSKVMSWVALERAVKIAGRLGRNARIHEWRAAMKTIHDEVMERGWSPGQSAFRQRYESEALDASVLLIPVMGFLPADHPGVRSTVDRIAERLMHDGFVYRFDPQGLPEPSPLPLGTFEGAFLPCTCWLITAYAMAGRTDEAEALLQRVDAAAGELGLVAEEVEGKTSSFLGNLPLVFAQVEYVRAVMAVAKARPFGKMRLMAGKLLHTLRRAWDGVADTSG